MIELFCIGILVESIGIASLVYENYKYQEKIDRLKKQYSKMAKSIIEAD